MSDILIDHTVVRRGLAEMLSPLQQDTPGRALRLLHEPDPSGETVDGNGVDDGLTVLVREGSLSIKSLPRRKGPGEAAFATFSAVIDVQCPAEMTLRYERSLELTVNRLKQLLEDAEWEGLDGTLIQVEEWETTDAGISQSPAALIAYAALRIGGTVVRCAGTDINTGLPEEAP